MEDETLEGSGEKLLHLLQKFSIKDLYNFYRRRECFNNMWYRII